MGDAFSDRIETSLAAIRDEADVASKIDVPVERRFTGFDAYKQVIACCDVVLLCTPPQFRPLHLKTAVDAGRHVFAEKPVAVDAPGVRSVLATCEEAKRKGLSVVSGLCLRYDNGFRETIRRIHEGEIGDVVSLEANDYRGTVWVKPRESDWTDMVWQMRNWYYFTWLSGDFNVEQHVHYLDVCSWVMGNQYPVQAVGMGGRQVRTEPQFGQIFDHFSVVYEFANGVTFYSNCRQQSECARDMSVKIAGANGRGLLTEKQRGQKLKSSKAEWVFSGPANLMYQTEHDELFASIRNGTPINNGEYMAKSTLLGIMGRMAAYTGQRITWEMALNSQEDLTPPAYDWNVALAVPPVARPGVTKFR
ncbi:MAG: Gfo/Idh/MocA family oxidoreductase, partial [Planctomycetota bacterium]|nr:Gfo/Idh/MocA family oxidoreductase [Planctomycetota bacterium]